MKKKYISEHIQTLVDVVYFKSFSKCSVAFQNYITYSSICIDADEQEDNGLPIYDSLIYPDFLPDKYFNNYSDKEHESLELFLSSQQEFSNVRLIRVYNIYRITQEIRFHLAHYLHSYFDIVDIHNDEPSFNKFQLKLNFILQNIQSEYKDEYFKLWRLVINHIPCDNTIVCSEIQKPLGSYIDTEIIERLKNSFQIA